MPDNSPRQLQTPVGPFDPAARLFLAQDRRPAGLAPVAPDALSPLQRALLVIDGTVTIFLSAWAMEPILVTPLGQRATVLPGSGGAPAAAWLEAPAGTPVVERTVLLTGAHSHRLFACAESVICSERLPAALRDGLVSGTQSLGQLLLMPGFESRREGLWYGREQPGLLPPEVTARVPPDFLTRTYRVSSASQPLMVITERFPWALRD